MNPRTLWARILATLGGIAMLLGTVDPLEGSLLILPGSGLIALGTFIGKSQRSVIRYWLWVFGLIAVGVAAMFVLSDFGGIGGKSGHSMWWGIFILPYPAGWLMALVGGIAGLVRFLKAGGQKAHA
jgi:purine-cytosine permease-like protein